jgi:hypothetical protein
MEMELQKIKTTAVKDHETAATGINLNCVTIVQDIELEGTPKGLNFFKARGRAVPQINRRLLAAGRTSRESSIEITPMFRPLRALIGPLGPSLASGHGMAGTKRTSGERASPKHL